MTGHVRTPLRVTLAVLLLLLAACGGGADLDDVASVATQAPVGEEPGPDPAEPGEPTVEPEGSGPEEPLPPSRQQGSATFAGPDIGPGDTWAVFSAEQQTDCLRVVLAGEFPGDAVVQSVGVGPQGAFQRAEDACDSDPDDGPRCTGFVFTDGAGGCRVGVRWLPDSRQEAGTLTLAFSGTCRASTGACAQVRPGTAVTFTSSAPLEARLEAVGSPDGGEAGTGGGTPGGTPGGGATPESGESPDAGTETPEGGAAETPSAPPDEGTP